MGVFDNPVLQRELLVNLRTHRSFLLLLFFQMILAGVVYLAWPQDNVRLDLAEGNNARQLVDLFFLGQFVLASLMAPSFAAGAISGEKERSTYEMLIASPVHPQAITFGKLTAALAHIAILIFSSLPIVMLCLPLGGVSFYEVLAAYFALLMVVGLFGMISVACSSFFKRTAASLVVSYLVILPLALAFVFGWQALSGNGELRLQVTFFVLPGLVIALAVPLFYNSAARMLYPPDVGSEGQEVVDIDEEAEAAIGLVIQRDQFPDRLFAPPKRTSLMNDGTNPVYDKEMRSEIFGQGTLMLRLAIQISMLLAVVLMALFLYIFRSEARWYIIYVCLFNVLVGPVFSAGSVTSERERETLDLLLTTTITPWQILWGKLLSGLRVSTVLTGFLVFPLILAFAFVPEYYRNFPSILAYLVIILLTCLTTSMIGLACSCVFRKTSISLLATYSLVVVLFAVPAAVQFFAVNFFPTSQWLPAIEQLTSTSPFSAAYEFPLFIRNMQDDYRSLPVSEGWHFMGYAMSNTLHFFRYVAFTLLLNSLLFGGMVWLFNMRWRVSAATT